ncbi:MAG: histidinol-phosphate transaminase [Saprospiraceae bacterium]|nr:histidinol-phosphate transaminase [Saprospiraceae bacterium]
MSDTKTNINIFKSHLTIKSDYVGGKAKPKAIDGQQIYKLSSNENLLGSSPKALAAIQTYLQKLNEYPDQTDARLREALAEFYGASMTSDHFLTGNSGSEILELIARAFLDPGLEAIIASPTFMPYRLFSEKMGAKVLDIPLQEPNFQLNVAEILSAINDKTRLLFLTSPNNPTGSYIPTATLEYILQEVPAHVVVVLDEVYFQFADQTDYTTALPYVMASKNIIGVNSFSKAYGLAGLRVGYAYTHPELARYIRQLHRPFLLNALSLNAAIGALSDSEFLRQTVELVQQERNFLYEQLNQLPIEYWKSQGNFFLTRPPLPPKEFEAQMLAQGIMVRPVENFGAKGCVRVTIGTREANLAMLAALRSVLKVN